MSALVALLLLTATPELAQAQPRQAESFQHAYRRTVGSGGGAYAGYHDTLEASGHYEIEAPRGGVVTVHAYYSWEYRSSEKYDTGAEDREVTVDARTRLYTGDRIDLDEYDGKAARELATWLWIPIPVRLGEQVRILERTFEVVDVATEIGVEAASRRAILLRARGTGERHDAYGDFTHTFTDEYWFDAETGLFLASHYREVDDGTYEGQAASFVVEERVSVEEASYVPPDYVGMMVRGACFGSPVIALLALLGWWSWRKKWGRRLRQAGMTEIGVQRLRRPVALPPVPAQGVTRWFAPFLDHWVRVALSAGDHVHLGTRDGGNSLAGLAIRHLDADVGTILADDSDVCELLRADARIVTFFSEVRHPALKSVLEAMRHAPSHAAKPPAEAYNLYETYDVLRLGAIPDVSYDSDVVARMKPADLDDVDALSRRVYGFGAKKWVAALLAHDEIGFVVRREGKLVAFALATAIGTHGRLHTNTVDPDHRGRGLGKELMRARLRALRDLGVETVITEIASWNHASLEIAKAQGFEKVGEMYVESAQAVRVERKFVRR